MTGIITVPGGGDRNPPAVWLGVDHDSCPDNALSLGFKLKTLSPSGVPTFAGERRLLSLRIGFHHSCIEQRFTLGAGNTNSLMIASPSLLVTKSWPPLIFSLALGLSCTSTSRAIRAIRAIHHVQLSLEMLFARGMWSGASKAIWRPS